MNRLRAIFHRFCLDPDPQRHEDHAKARYSPICHGCRFYKLAGHWCGHHSFVRRPSDEACRDYLEAAV